MMMIVMGDLLLSLFGKYWGSLTLSRIIILSFGQNINYKCPTKELVQQNDNKFQNKP